MDYTRNYRYWKSKHNYGTNRNAVLENVLLGVQCCLRFWRERLMFWKSHYQQMVMESGLLLGSIAISFQRCRWEKSSRDFDRDSCWQVCYQTVLFDPKLIKLWGVIDNVRYHVRGPLLALFEWNPSPTHLGGAVGAGILCMSKYRAWCNRFYLAVFEMGKQWIVWGQGWWAWKMWYIHVAHTFTWDHWVVMDLLIFALHLEKTTTFKTVL